jgi:hypothetical protein
VSPLPDAPLEELRRAWSRARRLGARCTSMPTARLWSTWLERPGRRELGRRSRCDTGRRRRAAGVERDARALPEGWGWRSRRARARGVGQAQRDAASGSRARDGDRGFAQVDLVGGAPHWKSSTSRAPSAGAASGGDYSVRAWRARGACRAHAHHLPRSALNAPFYARCGFRVLAPEDRSPALRAVVDEETARGLDPKQRVVMRCAL